MISIVTAAGYLVIALLFPLVAYLFLIVFVNIRYRFSSLRFLPGIQYPLHPIFGNIISFLNNPRILGKHDYPPNEYGHVRRIPEYWGRTRIQVQDPEWINHILVTNASNYVRSDYLGLEDVEIYTGDSLLTLDGYDHKKLRKIAAPAFRPSILKSLVGVMEKTASGLISRWDGLCDRAGGAVNVSVRPELAHLSLDILGLCMFGHEFNAIKGESTTADSIYHLATIHMPTKIGAIPGYKKLMWLIRKLIMSNLPLLGPQRSNMETLRSMLHEIDRSVTSQVFRSTYGSFPGSCKVNQSALFDCINQAYANDKITRSELVDLFTSFIVAGLDTTSLALTWTLLLLANHPEEQKRCREEVEGFNNKRDGKPLSWDDFNGPKSKLPWCKAVLQESMRLFPPVPHIVRKPLVDDVICGCPVPAGTNIVIQIIKVHRSEAIWGPTANVFDPDRFLNPDSNIHPCAYMPFADGRHKCIGNQFAMTHMQISLSKLLANYEFTRLLGETGIPVEKCTVTMAPWNELILSIRKI